MLRAVVLLLYDGVLVCLARDDYRSHKIKDSYVKMLLLLSAAAVFAIPEVVCSARVMGMFLVSVPMLFIAYGIPGSFGGGDIKLTFACGAFLGWELLLKGTVIAIFLAGSYCLWMIYMKKAEKNVQFALGPFLGAGYLIASFQLS